MQYDLLTYDYPPAVGGVARYNAAIVRALGDRSDVHVLSRSRHWLRFLCVVLRIPTTSHCYTSEMLPIGTLLLIRRCCMRGRYSIVAHGLDVQCAQRNFRKRLLARLILRRADRVITNSEHTRNAVTHLGIPQERIQVLVPPLGVNGTLKASSASVGVLSVGRLIERKGFDTLIEAMRLVQSRHPHVELTIVGDGPLRQQLEQQMHDSGVRGQIKTKVNDEGLAEEYAQCALFAMLPRELSEKDVEGFGIVYLEAASFGKPTVGTNSGGVAEAIVDGVTGILVPEADSQRAADAICRLLDDQKLARKFGEAGRQRVRTHFDDRCFDERARRIFGVPHGQERRITVVIPVYQHERELSDCLASLEKQTYQDFEVVVVDDGSDPPILKQTRQQLNIRWISQKHVGAPTARNRGAAETQSELIIFCDADIVFAQNALERMVFTLDMNPGASYVYPAFRFGWKCFHSLVFDAERLRRIPYIHTTALMRRAHLPGFDETLKRFQDWDLWLTMSAQGHIGHAISDTLFRVRNTKGTMSRWLPSFVYRLPWKIRRVRSYETAAQCIRDKHHLR
ncbi:MAG: glycosyltransferase [Candidatus Uhrbacteria bacterium]